MTKQNQSPDIHAMFSLATCIRVSTTGYYTHLGIDVDFRYFDELPPIEWFDARPQGTELVIVVGSEDAAAQALRISDYPCQVIQLKDLQTFVLYRAFNDACFDLRIAQTCFKAAQEDMAVSMERYHAGSICRGTLEEAENMFSEASSAFFAVERPPFYKLTNA